MRPFLAGERRVQIPIRPYAHAHASISRPYLVYASQESADFYIGVQALRHEMAEFSLTLRSRPRQRTVSAYTCGRLDRFCPKPELVVTGNATLDVDNPILGATSAAGQPGTPGLGAGLAALCTAVLLWQRQRVQLVGGGPRLRR